MKRLALGLVAALSGCAPPATLAEIEAEVWRPSCVFSACHQGVGAARLSLEGKTHARLVNVAALDADGRTLVVPQDLAASYLYEKLSSIAPQAGTRMPQGAVLDEEALQMVRSWIEAGARDD
jgi:hypothetical protein